MPLLKCVCGYQAPDWEAYALHKILNPTHIGKRRRTQ
jgi:hypothetical protein